MRPHMCLWFMYMCLHVHMFMSLQASYICLCQFNCFRLSPSHVCVLLCVFVRISRPRPLLRLAAELVWLLVHIPAQAVTPLCDSKSRRGGRPSSWAESENYYPSYKDGLHCCSTGTPLCSRSVTQCLLTNPQCKSSQSTSSRPCVVVLWKPAASKNACLLPFRYLVMADWDEGEVVTTQTITKHGNAVVSPVAFGMPLQ